MSDDKMTRDELLKEFPILGPSIVKVVEGANETSEITGTAKQWEAIETMIGEMGDGENDYPSLVEIRGAELAKLWDSTAEFHERFETIEDKEHPFIPAQYRAFMEEVAEFSIEVLRDNAADPANLERELADVIVVGMGLLMAHGRTLADLRAAMRAIAEKNDAKTHKTHAKNSKGKVAKREATTGNGDAGSA